MGNITFTLPSGNDEGCKLVAANPTVTNGVMTVRPNLVEFTLVGTTPTATVPETNTVAVAALRALSGTTEARSGTSTIAQPATGSDVTITDAAPNSFDYEDVADDAASLAVLTVNATTLEICAYKSATVVKTTETDNQASQNWTLVRSGVNGTVTQSGGVSTVTTAADFFHYRAGSTSPDVGRTIVIADVTLGAQILSVTSARTATFLGTTTGSTKAVSITRSGTASATSAGTAALATVTATGATDPAFVPGDVGKTIVTPTSVSKTITGWGSATVVYVDYDLTIGTGKAWSITNTVA